MASPIRGGIEFVPSAPPWDWVLPHTTESPLGTVFPAVAAETDLGRYAGVGGCGVVVPYSWRSGRSRVSRRRRGCKHVIVPQNSWVWE